jgi:hypothetical protein
LAESVVFVVTVFGADVVLGAVVAVFGLLTGFGAEVFAGVLGRDTDELFATAMVLISFDPDVGLNLSERILV